MQFTSLYTNEVILARFSSGFFDFRQILQIITKEAFDFQAFAHYNDHSLFALGGSMKKITAGFLCFLLLLLTACSSSASVTETTTAETVAVTVPPTTLPVTTVPLATVPTEPETAPAIAEPLPELTEKEKNMLLKIGMAELGDKECTECIALVMCTVLNRVETEHSGNSSVRSVLMAPGQFTPVANGSYYSARPNQRCYEALELVLSGWDESQGALYYEWCQGESWHSKNLHLLFQHCDVRFYD